MVGIVSQNGNLVAFRSFASNLAAPDSDFTADVLVRERGIAPQTKLLSVNSGQTASGNAVSSSPAISADGTTVVFLSSATDLVAGISDTNGGPDVFAVRSIGIAIDNVTVTEGNTGTVNAVFTVTLLAPSAQTVTVQVATSDGTANA